MVGLLSLSPARWICARRKAQAEGRLYSFQAQKLNLISNINLFSLRSLVSVPLSFSPRALFLPSTARRRRPSHPHRTRRAYIILARLRIMFFAFPINITRHNDLRSAPSNRRTPLCRATFSIYNYGCNNTLSLKKSGV